MVFGQVLANSLEKVGIMKNNDKLKRYLQVFKVTLQCMIFPISFKLITSFFSKGEKLMSLNDIAELVEFGVLVFFCVYYYQKKFKKN